MNTAKLPINIPNILTVTRILITPLFVICLLRDLFHYALIFFAIAGISDSLDGLFARYFNQRTALGSYLDPIADKMLLTSAFVSLAILHIIPGSLAVIVISRDVLIILGVMVFSIVNISFEAKPSLVSKWTTVFQVLTVILVLLNPNIQGFLIIKKSFYWATAGLTIVSGFHYIYIGMNLIQNATGNNHQKQ